LDRRFRYGGGRSGLGEPGLAARGYEEGGETTGGDTAKCGAARYPVGRLMGMEVGAFGFHDDILTGRQLMGVSMRCAMWSVRMAGVRYVLLRRPESRFRSAIAGGSLRRGVFAVMAPATVAPVLVFHSSIEHLF
jgi:hypothetical protein